MFKKGSEPPAGVTIYRVAFERMSDLDKFNYECAGQISLFIGFLKEKCDTKPEIGAKLIFHYEGHDYDCIVESHCRFDFFYVRFIAEIHQTILKMWKMLEGGMCLCVDTRKIGISRR